MLLFYVLLRHKLHMVSSLLVFRKHSPKSKYSTAPVPSLASSPSAIAPQPSLAIHPYSFSSGESHVDKRPRSLSARGVVCSSTMGEAGLGGATHLIRGVALRGLGGPKLLPYLLEPGSS